MPSRPLSRSSALVGFALGGAALYLLVLLGATLGLGEEVPLLGWIGFGVVACVGLAAGAGLSLFLVRSARAAGAEPVAHPARLDGVRRVLVVADAECSAPGLCAALVPRAGDGAVELFVAAPALLSPLHYLDSDVDEARAAAQARLDGLLGALAAAGVTAHGSVGSESPLEAIADALARFPADEVVVATAGGGARNWLEQDIVERARRAHGLPVSSLDVSTPALR